jgi:hypothetical protein
MASARCIYIENKTNNNNNIISIKMENHLIIGLGGTGGSIVREIRKRIYEEFRTNTPSQVNLEYLYVDSSPADLNDHSTWKTMGGSVHLTDAQKVSIHGVDAAVLNNLPHYPGVQSFISEDDKTLLNDISTLISDGIGGQRRRLGRLLFANNLSSPNNFVIRLKSAVNTLTNNGNNVVTFHVCAGLAGGTGSGSVVDVISQIRKEYAPAVGVGDSYKLHLYLYVPEIVIANPKHSAGYYQANGYAALSELNAMSVGAYKPYDVTGKKNAKGEVVRLLDGCDAFESAFLFSNVNEANKQLKLGTELSAAVADFLFQKIVASNMISGGQMARLEKVENGGTTPESDGAGKPIHSRSFLSFGIKRVEYPETEVEEYVTYSFVKQAAQQLQYNKWNDGLGFIEVSEEEIGLGFKSDIENKATKERLLLSDDYVTLSKPIVTDDTNSKKIRPIRTEWNLKTDRFEQEVKNKKEWTGWLADFAQKCDAEYTTNFREHGVEGYYRMQRAEKTGYAAYIRRHIEKLLFAEWKDGQKSILEIEKYVNLLISDCNDRISKFDGIIADFETQIKQRNVAINQCKVKWANQGNLAKLLTKSVERNLADFKIQQCEYYTASTLIKGYGYAKELLAEIKTELSDLLRHTQMLHALITDLLKNVDEQVKSKCKPQTSDSSSDVKTIKKYDDELVRQTTNRFVTNEEEQKNNATQVRSKILELLGDESKYNFRSLIENFDLQGMEDVLVKTCLTNATRMMDNLAQSDPTQRMLNVNILEKIKQEYNTDDKLETFVRNLVHSAQCFLQFNPNEISKVLPAGRTDMMRIVQLSIPDYNDPTNFRKKFINTFKGVCLPFCDFTEDSDVSVSYKSNRITVVAAASGLPLRFIANVANLKNEYEAMLIGVKAPLNKMVLHTETFQKPLPELFEKSIQQKSEELIPTIILAYSMGLVIDKTNPTTGETFKAIGFPDDFGDLGDWLNLGKNPFDSVKKLSTNDSDIDKVSNLVEETVRTQYIHNEKKAELKKTIATFIKTQILPLCGNNDLDEQYKLYKEQATKIFNTKLKEQ